MIPIYTISIILAILAQAFFTASEMAFTAVNRIKLKSIVDSGSRQAKRLDKFLGEEGAYLGVTLTGTNITVVVSSVLATRVFAEYFDTSLAPVFATLCMVPITLIFAEIIPKMIAKQISTSFALQSVGLLEGFQRVFQPVIKCVNSISALLLRPFGKRKASFDLKFTKGDLKSLLLMGHETGEVEADEVELIHKVLEFGAKRVESIMVPLYRVSSISIKDTVSNLKRLVSVTGFSRVPVYEESKNIIKGIINIYDILYETDEIPSSSSLEGFLREPVYLSRKDGLDIALARLRHREQPMGIVVDEEENVVGIVTIEDILEEIVGEIYDTG